MTTPRTEVGKALTHIIWETSRFDEGTISAVGANNVARSIITAGWRSPEQVAALLADQRDGITAVIEARRIICPVHHMPDCSPMLNCRDLLKHLHEQREIDARIVRTFTKGTRCPKCWSLDGNHGCVHVRHGNGGGHNRPYPQTGDTP